MPTQPPAQRHDRSALILYGSETGTAQDAAELLGRTAERLRFHTTVAPLDAVNLTSLRHPTLVLFAVSTTGQGDVPANARRFWKSLLRKKLPPGCLAHVTFSTFGFGDSSYVKFNWAARKLHKRLEQLGAREFYPRGEADEQHDEGTDGAFLPWSLDLKKYLLEHYPLPDGVLPIPDEEFLPPKVILQIANEFTPSDVNSATTPEGPKPTMDTPIIDACLQEPYDPTDLAHDHIPPPADLIDIPNHEILTLEQNERITSPTHFQDVRHLVLSSTSQIDYQPGDILTIYPKNFPTDVSALLALQNWSAFADLPLTITDNPAHPSPATYLPALHTLPLPLSGPPTLRSLLLHSLDITAIPRRHFFSLCAAFCADATHRARLAEFANPAYTDEFFDYTSRPRRSILEVLHDFPSVQLPWLHALALFPRLRGRQFSLSSGGVLKHPAPGTTEFHLTVALVKYRTVLRKVRQGVCSRYLAAVPPGTRMAVTLARGAFSVHRHGAEMLRRPLLLVAPGTGVAPMRSLLWEREQVLAAAEAAAAAAAATKTTTTTTTTGAGMTEPAAPRAPAVLIFGGRKRDADFLYGAEWPALDVRVEAAWSRERREKEYVQDVIRREGALVWALLRPAGRGESGQLVEGEPGGDGTVFVCGSSGRMPVAVRKALVDVFQARGGMGEMEAEEAVGGMEGRGRYMQETW